MKVTNDRVKSIVFSKNRDFRQTAINMLNGIAYTAEKLPVNSIEEVQVMIAQDKLALNIVIDVAEHSNEELADIMPKMATWTKNKPNIILLWHTEEQAEIFATHKDEWASPNISCGTLPQSKQTYSSVLHASRDHLVPKAAPPKAAPVAEKKAKPAKAAIFFEASAHVKDAIADINAVMKDPTATKNFANIGQRFNGIIGTFAFFGDKPGYRELVELSDYIDTVARIYADDELAKIGDDHLKFVLNAAKCAYLMLKDMRENEKLSNEQAEAFMGVSAEFDTIEGVKKKERNSQADIDSLLDAEQLKAS